MYNSFFGFREKPFKLVPNPDYLFLSKSHEVALAHLNYATDQGDGFVVITGEVGTGKTTLCRNYLEQLGDETKSAYIFNPKLDSIELLTSICHEFGIETRLGPSTKDLIVKHLDVSDDKLVEKIKEPTTKDLLDNLNQFLIAQNIAGHKVVLLIDEAQALTVDNLEMVRMVSNLETTRSKLLQIILVGQPELDDKLDAHELRQLAQRISLNCYLAPLSEKETVAYIQHRINIAAQRQSDIFSEEACGPIYKYAAGIPRLINIASDRVLLAAYSQNRQKVNRSMVKKVIAELTNRGREEQPQPLRIKPVYVWVPLVVIILVLAVIVTFQSGIFRQSPAPPDNPTQSQGTAQPDQMDASVQSTINSAQSYKIPAYNPVQSPAPALSTTPAPKAEQPASPPAHTIGQQSKPGMLPASSNMPGFSDHLTALDPLSSRMSALTVLLSHWRQPRPNPAVIPANIDERSFFQIAARQYGLRSYVVAADWPMIKKLNLPAIVVFKHPLTQQGVYLALTGWQNDRLLLTNEGTHGTIETDLEAMRPHLQGTAYVFWKNTLGYDAIISQGAHTRAVVKVKTLLRKVGYPDIPESRLFDRETRLAVKDFQKRQHIKSDGLVGPLTKILLIQQANAFNLPLLDPGKGAGA